MQFDKRIGLLAFAIALWVWMGYSIASHSAKKIIKTTIIQSSRPITYLDAKIYPKKKEVIWIDKLYFPKSNELRHPTYGYLGYRRDFVIYFDTDFKLKKPQRVKFTIYSDDGFCLKIDGKTIMQYIKDRPFSKSEAVVRLAAGRHHLHIKYFQGFGQLGIVGYYQLEDGKRHFIGKSAGGIEFIEQ